MPEHSPIVLPVRLVKPLVPGTNVEQGDVFLKDAEGHDIARVYGWGGDTGFAFPRSAAAEYIVEACNNWPLGERALRLLAASDWRGSRIEDEVAALLAEAREAGVIE